MNQPPNIREVLPSNSRDLDFSITVRDNHPGSGGLAWDYISLESSANAGPFYLIEPNGDDNIEWESNTLQTVKWEVANTDQAPVNCSTVDIYLSYSNGNKFNYTLVQSTANDGETTVMVPDSVSVKARVMVKAHDNYFFDISDKKFVINQGPEEPSSIENTLESQISIFPNPATENLSIQFESLTGMTNVELYNVQGALISNKSNADMSSGSIALNVAEIPSGVYFIKMQIEDTVVTKKVVIQ